DRLVADLLRDADGRLADLAGRLRRYLIRMLRAISDILAQLLARLRREQQRSHRTDRRTCCRSDNKALDVLLDRHCSFAPLKWYCARRPSAAPELGCRQLLHPHASTATTARPSSRAPPSPALRRSVPYAPLPFALHAARPCGESCR